MANASACIIERNRRNATHSTGPRSNEGKAIARTNATKHGLCANPAAGTVEDADAFQTLYDDLCGQLDPVGPIEEGLAHRIAVCLWRLQRAARIDAAISNLATTAVEGHQAEVQQWLGRLNCDGWYATLQRETDPAVLQRFRSRELIKPGERLYRFKRPYLSVLDEMREREIPRSAAAITAMGVMLNDLVQGLTDSPARLLPVEAQQLAWLLGESAARLRAVEEDGLRGRDDFFYPDEEKWATQTDMLIGEARKRAPGTPLPAGLASKISCWMATLRQQREVCYDPCTETHYANKQTAALLPDLAFLDRLLRYETHADRTLQRTIETLARLRGVPVGALLGTLAHPASRIQIVALREGSGQVETE